MNITDNEYAGNDELSVTATKKSEIDIYATLEAEVAAGLITPYSAITTSAADSAATAANSTTASATGISGRFNISSKSQALIAPELHNLKANQDLHNRLQTATAGLATIKDSIRTLASELQTAPADNALPSSQIQSAIESISTQIESATYGGSPLFTIDTAENNQASPNIQASIVANAKSVTENADGQVITGATETFILATKSTPTLYSFPAGTPLEEINKATADVTQDSTIHPLIYVESESNGQAAVVNRDGNGTTVNPAKLTLTPIDGELFSTPLNTYTPNKGIDTSSATSIITVKTVENTTNITLSEESSTNKISGTINLAQDNTQAGVDQDKMRTSNHALTRTEQFNQRLGDNGREGDGFAQTPIAEEPAAPRHKTRAANRAATSARDGNAAQPGTNTTNSDDVMLLPDDSLQRTVDSAYEPEQETGITAAESLDQTENAIENTSTPENNTAAQIVQNRAVNNTFSTNAAPRGVDITFQVQSTNTDNSSNTATDRGDQQNYSENDNTSNNGIRQRSTSLNPDTTLAPRNTSIQNPDEDSAQESIIRITENTTPDEESTTAESTEAAADTAENAITNTTARTTDLAERDTAAAINRNSNTNITADITDSNNTSEAEPTISTIPQDPVQLLQGIDGVVNQTLAFTLEGKRGSLDFVIGAGNTSNTVAFAINSTQSITGVTASSANNKISLAGATNSEFTLTLQSENTANNAGAATPADTASNTEQIIDNTAAEMPSNTNSDLPAGVELSIDLSNLGRTEVAGKTYSLNSLQQAETSTSALLNREPALTQSILENALNEISSLESNLDSLSSLNARNTEYVSEQITGKLLPAGTTALSEDDMKNGVEQALNLVAVGISNSLSTTGGDGYGISNDPLASLNLLHQTPVSDGLRSIANRSTAALADPNSTEYRLANSQAVSSYHLSSKAEESTISAALEPAVSPTTQNGAGREAAPSFTQVAEELAASRSNLEMMQEAYTYGVEKLAENNAQIARAADNFFANIENARQTIRELGRSDEAENYNQQQVEDAASDRLNTQRKELLQPQVAPAASETLDETETRLLNNSQEFIQNNFKELLTNIGETLGDTLIVPTPNLFSTTAENPLLSAAPAPVSSPPAGFTDQAPVVTTAAAQATSAGTAPPQQDNSAYKSLNTIIDGQIGNITVHGQDYTLTDMQSEEGRQLFTENPELANSVLEKAIEEINIAQELTNELVAGELLDKGDAISGAIDSYGSDQSATTPSVAAHAAYIQAGS